VHRANSNRAEASTEPLFARFFWSVAIAAVLWDGSSRAVLQFLVSPGRLLICVAPVIRFLLPLGPVRRVPRARRSARPARSRGATPRTACPWPAQPCPAACAGVPDAGRPRNVASLHGGDATRRKLSTGVPSASSCAARAARTSPGWLSSHPGEAGRALPNRPTCWPPAAPTMRWAHRFDSYDRGVVVHVNDVPDVLDCCSVWTPSHRAGTAGGAGQGHRVGGGGGRARSGRADRRARGPGRTGPRRHQKRIDLERTPDSRLLGDTRN